MRIDTSRHLYLLLETLRYHTGPNLAGSPFYTGERKMASRVLGAVSLLRQESAAKVSKVCSVVRENGRIRRKVCVGSKEERV